LSSAMRICASGTALRVRLMMRAMFSDSL